MARLVEREQVIAAVGGALYRAHEGKGTALFVIGEPGLGKTSVLHEARLMAEDFIAASAGCFENETSLPFGLLDRLFEGLGAPLSGDCREAAGGDAGDRRATRYSALMGWLRGSAPSKLLLCVDDVHWADPDSLTLLSMICRRLEGLGVALVAAMRPWPSAAADCARGLAADGCAVVEKLAVLSPEGAEGLLLGGGAQLQRTPGEIRDAVVACAGNPLLLREVAEAWSRGDDVLGDGSAGMLQERILLPRFAGTGQSGYELARCAAILGTRFDMTAAAAIAQLPGSEVAEALEALLRTGLVREAGAECCDFVHPLFRQALYDGMPAPLRESLHVRAFEVLLARGSPAEAAPHAVAGRMLGDGKAVDTMLSVGRAALAAGAPASGARDLASAIELAGGNVSPALHVELAQARLVAGQVDEAIEGLNSVLSRNGLSDDDRLMALRMLVQAYFGLGNSRDVDRLEAQAVELAVRVDVSAACDILLDSSFVGWLTEGPVAAQRKVSQVMDLIAEHGIDDERLLATVSAARANLAFIQGNPTGDEVLSELYLVKSGRSVLPGTWDATFGYVNLSKLAERFDEDSEEYLAMATAAENEGAVLAFQTYSINYADTLWRIGRIQEAYELVGRASDLADLVPGLMPFAWVGMAHLSQELGLDEQSREWARRLDELLGFIGESAYLRLWLTMFEVRDRLRTGHVDDAADAALRLAELAEASSIREPCVVPWHATAIEALVTAGRLDGAAKLIEDLEKVNERLPCHTPKAAAAAGRAMIAWRAGDEEGAERLFDKALTHNAAVPMPLAHAETLIAKGRFLRQTGRAVEARGVLRQALEIVDPLGAVRLQRIAQIELSAAGGRRSRAGGRPGANDLTAQEARVAELAAGGLTNKQIALQMFLSPKTVDHHLSRAYSKLGISSRRELMLRASELLAWRDRTESAGNRA